MKDKLKPLLEVKHFSLDFQAIEKGLVEKRLQTIHDVNVTIYPGEIVAIVGESGSGKSLLADAILGILPNHVAIGGDFLYKGEPLTARRWKQVRGREIQLIPQSVNSLNPLLQIGKQLPGKNKQQKMKVLEEVGLQKSVSKQYPFELSGGMTRKVLIANAILRQPELIIADEPTPGLDPAALETTLFQLKSLITPEKGMMFITHDIKAATQLADRIVVLKEGKTIDTAHVDDLASGDHRLMHPYTKQLWQSLPQHMFMQANKPVVEIFQKQQEKRVNNHALHIKALGYQYDDKLLFHDVNISVHPGEVVGIYGPSGVGKSTMAQLIAGYLPLQAGSILLGQQPIERQAIYPIQLIWQHPEKAINPHWKVKKMWQEIGEIDEEVMAAFGVKQTWFDRWPSELSGGQLQRCTLVRALTNKQTKYVIADEMTTMLDSISQAEIWQSLLTIARMRNIGIIVISHDHALLEKVADRVVDFTQFM